MKELIEKGNLAEAHPSQWAPFVVVGEGAAGIVTAPSRAPVKVPLPTTAPAIAPMTMNPVAVEPSTPTTTKEKTVAKSRPKPKAVDWKKSIFER
jgi:hypothetical protein